MKWLWLSCLLLLSLPVSGQELNAGGQQATLVRFQVRQSREVGNDMLRAKLTVERDGADAAKLAAAVNRVTDDALALAAGYPSINVSSGEYRTVPVYDKNRFSHWRVRHGIRIEGRDFGAAVALIGKLQHTMQLSGLTFSVAPETRRHAENELIARALASFVRRADIVRNSLKASRYRVKEISINTGGGPVRPLLGARAFAAGGAPPVAAGSSRLTVSVSGAIELQ